MEKETRTEMAVCLLCLTYLSSRFSVSYTSFCLNYFNMLRSGACNLDIKLNNDLICSCLTIVLHIYNKALRHNFQ